MDNNKITETGEIEEKKEKGLHEYAWTKYLMAVAGVGLIGLIISLVLLMEFSEPLWNVAELFIEFLFGGGGGGEGGE
ncbi:MAG: hypothetical protein KAR06_12345 [Deltaproteobacteria bacterium]|nr:hypothetical protein [Deltaproteobacteria bacterium]